MITECLIKIFEFAVTHDQEEGFDYVTLHSCALVNRQWCAVAMPMLWREPLTNLQSRESTRDRIHLPITTYMTCLSDEAKIILSKCGIHISTSQKGATFDYASFLQHLDNVTLFQAAERWIEKCNVITKDEQPFIPIYQNLQLVEQLFRMFMKGCKSLKELELKKSDQLNSLSDALLQLHLLPGAETSLSTLDRFSFDGCMQPEILLKASEISRNVRHLKIDCVCDDNEGLVKFIQAQQKSLLSLSMETTTFNLPKIQNALKGKVKSLTSLTINRIFSLDLFTHCKDLENLVITHGEVFSETLMEGFVNSQFPKLQQLQLQLDHPFLHQISTLIKNTNESLSSIYLHWTVPQDTTNFSSLIFTIINNCPNLVEYLGSFANEFIPFLPLFFEKCSKLEYFYIYDEGSNFYDVSNIMKSISKVIPKNLTMVWLSESWVCNVEALGEFLQGCEERLCEPLLFSLYNRTNQHDEIIQMYIDKNVLTENSSVVDEDASLIFR